MARWTIFLFFVSCSAFDWNKNCESVFTSGDPCSQFNYEKCTPKDIRNENCEISYIYTSVSGVPCVYYDNCNATNTPTTTTTTTTTTTIRIPLTTTRTTTTTTRIRIPTTTRTTTIRIPSTETTTTTTQKPEADQVHDPYIRECKDKTCVAHTVLTNHCEKPINASCDWPCDDCELYDDGQLQECFVWNCKSHPPTPVPPSPMPPGKKAKILGGVFAGALITFLGGCGLVHCIRKRRQRERERIGKC